MVATENPLKLTFTISEQDVFRFMLYHSLHAPGRRRFLWGLYVLWIILPTVLVLTLDYELPPDHPLFHTMRWIMAAVTIPMCAVGGLVFYWVMRGLQWVMLRFQARTWSRQTNGVVGEWEAEVSPEGVSFRGASVESVQRWSAFQRIVGTPEHILLYQGRNFAQMIPRRAFPSPEAAEEFLRCAQAWHTAAMTQ